MGSVWLAKSSKKTCYFAAVTPKENSLRGRDLDYDRAKPENARDFRQRERYEKKTVVEVYFSEVRFILTVHK